MSLLMGSYYWLSRNALPATQYLLSLPVVIVEDETARTQTKQQLKVNNYFLGDASRQQNVTNKEPYDPFVNMRKSVREQQTQLSTVHSKRESATITTNTSSFHNHQPFANESIEAHPWLHDFIRLHRNHSHPYIRYVCRGVCGGLGDRISGILQAFYMALCTNRRLLIDWTTPAPLRDFLQPNYIDWTVAPLSQDNKWKRIFVKHNNKVPLLDLMEQRNTIFYENPHRLPNGSLDMRINHWMGDDFLLNNYYECLSRHLQGLRLRPHFLYRMAFYTLFQWSPQVLQATQNIQHATTLSQPYIGMHIRTGRGVSFDDPRTESDNEAAWREYLKCAQTLKQDLKNYQMPIFLAADTNEAKLVLAKVDNTIVTQTDTEIFHVDRTRADQLHDPSAALLQVWVDLKLLLDSTCLVMGTGTKHGVPSKFSRMANWLAVKNNKQDPQCAVLWHDCRNKTIVQEAVAALEKQQE
jgi:hypothetical protein